MRRVYDPPFKILSLRHRGVKTPRTSGSSLEPTDHGAAVIPCLNSVLPDDGEKLTTISPFSDHKGINV